MFTAIMSLLGGSAFRAIWGEISNYFTARQQHKQELDRLALQEQIDASAHARNLEALRLQSDLGIKTIEAQASQNISQAEADAWSQLVTSTTKQTGIKFIDAWNGAIRPLLATLAILMVVFAIAKAGGVLTEWDQGLIASILGIYLADRSLAKRGK